MAHLISVEPKANILRILVHDWIDKKAYEHIVPYIDSAIDEYDTVRLLFDLTEYVGRDSGAMFEDAEPSLPHWAAVERVAIIGDKRFEPRAPAFCEPFTSATIKYFYSHQGKAAEEWIHEGVE
jgi:hypothetical protein